MDRTRRYYSLGVLAEAPGGIHHRECPCCRVRQRVEAACRSAYGMRAAGFSDRTIARQLAREGVGPYELDETMRFVADELPQPANRHVSCM